MLRYSMSRKVSRLVHFPKEIAEQLVQDLLPLSSSGFNPVKVEIVLEVSGSLGVSKALIPIKDLNQLIVDAFARCDALQSSVAEFAQQFNGYALEALSALTAGLRDGGYSPDLQIAFCELTFENGIRFKVADAEKSWTVPVDFSFQHTVEFDRDATGNLLHHGHDAQVDITLATGEMIVHSIAESLQESVLKPLVKRISLKETSKNRFSADLDKLQS